MIMNERNQQSSLPQGLGAGLRSVHYPDLLKRKSTTIEWFEAITENFLASQGRPRWMLEHVRRDYPLAFHGVSLSIGSPGPLDLNYLELLKNLINDFEPFLVSDHFCWTGLHGNNTHNLLPLALNKKTISDIIPKIHQIQDFLGCSMLFENASAYMKTSSDDMPEWEFITEVCRRTGCKLLLDINNIYVTSINFGKNPSTELAKVPASFVKQIHLAGHTNMGTFLFDTHSRAVQAPVWELYAEWVKNHGACPTMIEWDEDIPPFEILEQEVEKIGQFRRTMALPRTFEGAPLEL